jgi:uncharacterized protein YdbL (DUF1318 family)
MIARVLMAAAVLFSAGCQGPTVRLTTPEPIVVDINVRVDIYERASGSPAAKPAPGADLPAADARRRSRMGDIQTFKNSRLVGEGRDGLLSVLSRPEGSYGAYVEKTVAEENADRVVVMRQLGVERKLSLADVQAQQGELWRNRSFSGEWIEVPQDNNTWRWVQKR